MTRRRVCKHERTSRRWRWYGRWLRWHSAVDLKIPWEAFDARICVDCHEWLSLGPATETGEFAEQVALEIDAARLAADTDCKIETWHTCPDPACYRCATCDAIRLAYEIVQHDTTVVGRRGE